MQRVIQSGLNLRPGARGLRAGEAFRAGLGCLPQAFGIARLAVEATQNTEQKSLTLSTSPPAAARLRDRTAAGMPSWLQMPACVTRELLKSRTDNLCQEDWASPASFQNCRILRSTSRSSHSPVFNLESAETGFKSHPQAGSHCLGSKAHKGS